VSSVRYDFDRPERMDEAFTGADVFIHSYYIRFPYAGDTFERAVDRSAVLLDRAKRAGVRRVVHVSVSNADESSVLPYYRNKGRQERLVRESGLEFAILRPALVFGPGDIILNNIAWFLRRSPVFGLFGDGSYRVQPRRTRRVRACRNGRRRVHRNGHDDRGGRPRGLHVRGRRALDLRRCGKPREDRPHASVRCARRLVGHELSRARRGADARRGHGPHA
jgi:uncharacterized protein YbjT (DUF2867 family)